MGRTRLKKERAFYFSMGKIPVGSMVLQFMPVKSHRRSAGLGLACLSCLHMCKRCKLLIANKIVPGLRIASKICINFRC